MSDFFSLTVTVRAPRPSFSRRACACSPIGPAASRSWSRVVRSSGNVDSALICLAGAFSATGRSSMPRASRCSAVPTVGRRGCWRPRRRTTRRRRRWYRCRAGAASPRLPGRCPTADAPAGRAAERVPRPGAPPGCRRAWPAPRRSWRSACPNRRRRRRPARSPRGPWPAAPGRTPRHRSRWRPTSSGGLAEGLVERQLFEDGHDAADGVEHAAAGHAVDHAARRQHDGGGADQATGLMHRHRRSGAVHPGLVAGAGDHAAPAEPADQHRPAAQGGPGQLLDRREERVHVEVQHPASVHNRRC